jgi:hypothetical protein
VIARFLSIGLAIALPSCQPEPAFAESPTKFIIEQGRGSLPIPVPELVRAVKASWYGGGERLNQNTSTGERFRPEGHTAAHRTLPFGTRLLVTNLANGRSTVVRINDRGPAAFTGRDLDLSRGAAADLGMINAGEARVAVRILR